MEGTSGITEDRTPEDAQVLAAASRALVQHVRDIVVLFEADGTVALVNDSACAAYGRTREEMLRLTVADLRSPATRVDIGPQMREAAEKGLLFETVHVRADGSEFPVEVSSRGLEVGGHPYIMSVIRDISSRKVRESEREALLSDLNVANRQLDSMLRVISSAVGHVDTDAMFADVLRTLRAVLDADAALLLLRTHSGWEVNAQAGYDEDSAAGFKMTENMGFASMVAEKAGPLWVEDVQDTPSTIEVHARLGVRSMLGIPLYLDDRIYGVLECTWARSRLVSEAELVMLTMAADRIMGAVAGTRSYARSQRSRELEAGLADALAHLGESHVLAETMPLALETAARALGCDVAALGEYADHEFTVRYAWGSAPARVMLPDAYHHGEPSSDQLPIVRIGPSSRSAEWLRDSFGLAEGMVVPVRIRGEWVGAILFGRSEASAVREGDDLSDGFARRLSSAVAIAMANAREFESEHRIAETLQEALLNVDGSVEGIEFGVRYRSATVAARVGGDFYDVFTMQDGRVGVLIGDVSGKGLDAAVLTTLVKHTIRAFAHWSMSPAEVLDRSNGVLVASARMRDFASATLMVLDPRSGRVVYCQAGHPPAFVRRATGGIEPLRCSSPVVGALEDIGFEESEFVVEPGDVVVLYTDGLTEARDHTGAFFSEERVVRTLESTGQLDVHELVESLGGAAEQFAGGSLADDVAVVAFRLDR